MVDRIIIAFVGACMIMAAVSGWVQTDFEAPVTKVRIHMAGAPYGPYTPWTHLPRSMVMMISMTVLDDAIHGHWGSIPVGSLGPRRSTGLRLHSRGIHWHPAGIPI